MVEAGKTINKEETNKYLDEKYESWFIKHLSDFVRIPNLSPAYDPEYMTNGLREKAIE